ncbi:MAG: hypothetical protein Q9O74_04635 [Planctomycetota bacterium]|nr:hypothetical protein [Planctomycetota bacterium]
MLTRRQAVISSFLVLSAGGIGATAARLLASEPSAERADCPGKITCPLTGEQVCKDQCPLGAEGVTEAAGGGTVSDATAQAGVPSCCAKDG